MNRRTAHRRLWLAVLAAAALQAAADAPWVVRTWQSDEGLPDNTVVGIEQTPDGFLWVATKTGLARFDGLRFRPFPVTAAGAPSGMIKVLLVDRRGRLWVAKDQGVVLCVDRGRTAVVVGPDSVAGDAGDRLMVEDAEGAVWVSYSGGEVLRIRDGQVKAFVAADGLPAGGICQLALDGAGRLWFSRGGWLGVFREGSFRPLAQRQADVIAGARSGGLVIYAQRRLCKIAEGSPDVELGALPAEVPEVTPLLLSEDRSGCLWLGTSEAGLFRFDRQGRATAALPQQTVFALKEDREGQVWVGARGGGLSQLKPRVIELLTTGGAPTLEPVQSLCQDAEGLLWAIAWPNGQVLRSAGQGWSSLSERDGWRVPNALCVAADPRGGVWIGTRDDGVHRWQSGALAESLNTANGLAYDLVTALLPGAAGELWVGTGVDDDRAALQRRKAGRIETFKLPAGSGRVVSLALDAGGDCWAATYRCRLLRVRNGALTDETARTLAAPSEIRCLLGTPDGSLWIGYGGQGLGRLKDGRFSRCGSGQGLRDDYLSNMLPDGQGRLWFAGNRGIFSVREKELDDFAEGRAARIWSAAYGRSDGLLRLQASCNSWPGAQRGTGGRLLFAMQSGIAVVYPGEIGKRPEPPPVVVECVTANGRTVAAYGAEGFAEEPPAAPPLELRQGGAHLHLAPGQRRVEFLFTAVTFTKPENIGFKFRLHGLETEWGAAGTARTATYAQLPPGHYRFEVTACNSDGVWNEEGAALALTVAPYWWETAGFRVAGTLSVLGVLAGGLLLVARRRDRLKIERLEMAQATEKERARIARDMHDELGSRLTVIANLGELAMSPDSPPTEMRSQFGAIIARVRDFINTMDEVVWAVSPENDSLQSLTAFLSDFTERFVAPSGISHRLELDPDFPDLPVAAEARHNLLLAAKEALNNAVRHGAPKTIYVRIHVQDGWLTVEVADDGRGFEAGKTRAGGRGLRNLAERMRLIRGRAEIRSAPGQGTDVTLSMPLSGGPEKKTARPFGI